MSVKIRSSWIDSNTHSLGVRVYRNLETFTKDTLPDVYATIPKGTMSYEDINVEEGQTYFYMLSVFNNGQELFSECYKVEIREKDEYINDVDLLIFADATSFPSTNIIDSSTARRQLTLRGDVKIIADPTNFGLDDGVLYFDGYSDRISVNVDPLGVEDFTYETFLYPLNNNGGNSRIFQVGALGDTNSFALIRWGNNLTFERHRGGGNWQWDGYKGDAWFVNTWYHVALMRKSGRLYIFLNGIPVVEVDFNHNIVSGDIYIGQSQQQSDGTDAITAYMKSIRFTPKRARYPVSGFTVPTTKYPII